MPLFIPYVNTEFEDVETRRREATRYRPEEFIALQKLSGCDPPMALKLLGWHQDQQGHECPVPKGFLLYHAWEVVDGMRLGESDITARLPRSGSSRDLNDIVFALFLWIFNGEKLYYRLN